MSALINATRVMRDPTVESQRTLNAAPSTDDDVIDVSALVVYGAPRDDAQPDEWLAARPVPIPCGQQHETHVLAYRFVSLLRLAYRSDSEEWMQLVKRSTETLEAGAESLWIWELRREELIRAYVLGFLDCISYFTADRQRKPDFQGRYADALLREARQLPFRIARRGDNSLVDWVLDRMRPARDYQQSRKMGISTSQACDVYLREHSKWADGRRTLEIEMKAAISEAFAHEKDVTFNHHVHFTTEKGAFRRGRGFKGLVWVSGRGEPIANPFLERVARTT